MNSSVTPNYEDLTRINVETTADWRRIRESYSQIAIRQLDERLKANGLMHERDAHIAHLNEFIRQTFSHAELNVRVQGQNLEDMGEGQGEIDNYDMVLDEAVWTASNNRLEWNKTVALKRRTVPQDIENLMRDVLDRQQAADEELKQDMLHVQVQPLPSSVAKPAVDQDTKDTLDHVLQSSGKLLQATETQTERIDRMQVVMDDIRRRTGACN